MTNTQANKSMNNRKENLNDSQDFFFISIKSSIVRKTIYKKASKMFPKGSLLYKINDSSYKRQKNI